MSESSFSNFQWVKVAASDEQPDLIGRGGQIRHIDEDGCFVFFVEGDNANFAHPDRELVLVPERDIPIMRLLTTYFFACKQARGMNLTTLSKTIDDLARIIRAGKELIAALCEARAADQQQIERLRAYAVSARARLDLEGVRGDDGDDAEHLLHPGDLPPFEHR